MADELIDRGRTNKRTWSGQGERVVPFLVQNIGPDVVNWGVGGLPNRGEAHPSDPSLLSRDFTADEAGDGRSSLVLVRYSSSETAFRSSPPPEPGADGVTGFLWSLGVKTEQVSIPSAALQYVDRNNGQQGTPAGEPVGVWVPHAGSILENRLVISVEWYTFNPDWSTNVIIGQQHNRVHVINDERFLFQFGQMTPQGNNVYKLTGSWVHDSGTVVTETSFGEGDPDGNPKVLFPGPGGLSYIDAEPPNIGLGEIRAPFHELVAGSPERVQYDVDGNPVGTPSGAVNHPIRVVHRELREEIADGWELLPNVPPF